MPCQENGKREPLKITEQGFGMSWAEVYGRSWSRKNQGKVGKECRLSQPLRFTSAQPADARNNRHLIAQTQRTHFTLFKVPSLMSLQ